MRCTKCGVAKKVSQFDSNGYDAYGKPRRRSACKRCEKKRRREIYAKYGAKYARHWRAKNRLRIKQLNRNAYLRSRGVNVPYIGHRIGPMPGRKGVAHYRAYRRRNAKRIYRKQREWLERNYERELRKARAWRKRNRARINLSRRKRRTPEMVRVENHLRRGARLQGCGKFKAEQINQLLVDQHYLCANPFCRINLRTVKRHIDHDLSLARGGTNDIDNLQWLCAPCNRKKHLKTMKEWLPELSAAFKARLIGYDT
jgi:hypothetical protein